MKEADDVEAPHEAEDQLMQWCKEVTKRQNERFLDVINNDDTESDNDE